MFLNILLVFLVLLRIVIGVRLIITARQNRLPNLNWLALYFFAQGSGLLFAPTLNNPLANLPISMWIFIVVGILISEFWLIEFTQETFYQHRESPVRWFYILYAITSVITIYGIVLSKSNYNQSPWVVAYAFSTILIWVWHIWAANTALQKLKNESAVEDWVKARYQIVIAYSIVVIFGITASIIRILFAGGSGTSPLGNLMGIITLILQIINVLLQFLAWIMPESFRLWLNRNQSAHLKEKIHKQALAVFEILGSALATAADSPKMIVLFAIRKAIGKSIHTEDTDAIEEHVAHMVYKDWVELLSTRELRSAILISTKVEDKKVDDVIGSARRALLEHQSIFTMQAR